MEGLKQEGVWLLFTRMVIGKPIIISQSSMHTQSSVSRFLQRCK